MKGVWVEDRKVLKLRKGKFKKYEYLFNIIISDGMITGIETTFDKEKALDISGYELGELGQICMGLRTNGYDIEIETIQVSEEVDLDIGISEEELEKIIEQKIKEEMENRE